MNRTALIVVAVVAVFVGSLTWWFLENYEQYDKEIRTSFSGEAAKNQFYAAELFLKKYNMQVESLPSILELKEMPDSNDILFIPTKRFDIGADRVAELLEWVRKGGHLIVLARYNKKGDIEAKDDLFHELGVTTDHTFEALPMFGMLMEGIEEQAEKEEAEKEKHAIPEDSISEESDTDSNAEKSEDGNTPEEKKSAKKNKKWWRTVLDIQVSEGIENKKVRFWPSKWMVNQDLYETSWEVKGKKGAHLLEFHIDSGWVTLLSEIDFLTNHHIDKYDHAAFLHTLVHIDNSQRKLWIIRNDDGPSLLSILIDKHSPVVMTFIAFVLFWLWYASRRFGPMAPDPGTARRSMSEHIVSTGHFQWRNRNRTELLHSVQKALHEQIMQTRPLWVRLSDKELAVKLARLAGLGEAQVYKALTVKSVEKELEFSNIIEVFSIIRKKL